MKTADFLVVGGGVVGLTLALELRARHPSSRIVVLEKEARCGEHASGRNSGVLHAGFYYTADSLKARLTRVGNARLTAWCEEHGVPIRKCGKLVVARNAAEHERLTVLMGRAKHNGVALERITAAQARAIEPRVRTHEHALWSPNTAAVDPRAVMARLVAVAERRDISIWTATKWVSTDTTITNTSRDPISAGYVINAAGIYADQIARAYGFAHHYRMLPFKGLYLYARPTAPPLRTHIYPVPDLNMPFLGVHFTVTVGGRTKIGPTAMPAAWLENYHGLDRFDARELAGTLWRSGQLFLRNRSFRQHAATEAKKVFRRYLVEQARSLLDDVALEHFDRWGPPGIRAQLFDTERVPVR